MLSAVPASFAWAVLYKWVANRNSVARACFYLCVCVIFFTVGGPERLEHAARLLLGHQRHRGWQHTCSRHARRGEVGEGAGGPWPGGTERACGERGRGSCLAGAEAHAKVAWGAGARLPQVEDAV